MPSCRYFPECQRCNEVGDSLIPCTGGTDGIQCDAYEPMPDVSAMLALAAGLEADADRVIKAAKNARFGGGPRIEEAKHEASEWRSIARRIREACGETS